MTTPKKDREDWEKQGRPVVYNSKLKTIIKNLALQGKTNDQIIEILEISEATFYRWQKEYPDLKEEIIWARCHSTGEVVSAMLQAAMGYSHPEVKVLSSKGADGKAEALIVSEDDDGNKLMKHYPPNITAAKFILTNRDPDNWKERNESSVTVTNLTPGAEQELSDLMDSEGKDLE